MMMTKDNLWWLLLLVAAVLLFSNAVSAGEWNDKPVMCEQKEVVLETIQEKGEIPFMTAISATKVRDTDGLSDVPAFIPIQMFVNPKTLTYTIVEFHPSYNSICILAYGNDYATVGTGS
tara:strand:+ start:2430 stop:2786 length:357 start_codon:yes stop_codon:yes gene_type:complete